MECREKGDKEKKESEKMVNSHKNSTTFKVVMGSRINVSISKLRDCVIDVSNV